MVSLWARRSYQPALGQRTNWTTAIIALHRSRTPKRWCREGDLPGVIAGAGKPLRFIDPRSQSAGVARGVCQDGVQVHKKTLGFNRFGWARLASDRFGLFLSLCE